MTKLPMQGITITDNAKRYLGTSNAIGRYNLQIPAETTVNFSMLGYQPQQRTFCEMKRTQILF